MCHQRRNYMNYGYGEILDYLGGETKKSFDFAVALDTSYAIEKALKSASESDKKLLALDYALNFTGWANSQVARRMDYYCVPYDLDDHLCGESIPAIVERYGTDFGKLLYRETIAKNTEAIKDHATAKRIVDLMRTKLHDRPSLEDIFGYVNKECGTDLPKKPGI